MSLQTYRDRAKALPEGPLRTLVDSILIRMQQVDCEVNATEYGASESDRAPTGDDYNDLFDSILDEINFILEEEVLLKGVILHHADDGLWTILDQPKASPIYWSRFATREHAVAAYKAWKKL